MIKKLINTSFPLHYVFRVINSIVVICLLLFLFSCSALEVLPGLCYTDKDGTYLCPCSPENQLKCKIEDAVDDYVGMKLGVRLPPRTSAPPAVNNP